MNSQVRIQSLKSRLILFLSVLLLSILIITPFSLYFYNLENQFNNRLHELTELAGEVKYHDEVLTMSALAAATTKDPKWKLRYDKHALLLDKILTQAGVEDPIIQELLNHTTLANNKLIELEQHVFLLVEQNKAEEALGILSSAVYLDYKDQYGEGIHKAMQQMLSIAEENLSQSHRDQANAYIFLLTAFIVIFTGLWFYLIRYISTTDKTISKLVTHDELSGLLNRRTYNDELIHELNRAKRLDIPLTLALIDIDNFKAYNDTYGHPKGDDAIASVGNVLKDCARRSNEAVYRIGGEEFALIANYQDNEASIQQIYAILEEVRKQSIPHEYNDDYGILTVSIGVVISTDLQNATSSDLYQCADKALYKAKSLGRNRIYIFDPKQDN